MGYELLYSSHHQIFQHVYIKAHAVNCSNNCYTCLLSEFSSHAVDLLCQLPAATRLCCKPAKYPMKPINKINFTLFHCVLMKSTKIYGIGRWAIISLINATSPLGLT